MHTPHYGELILHAMNQSNLSQRRLATETGISQPTLSRIISGERTPKIPELVSIAKATGSTLSQITGKSSVADRTLYAARATNESTMDKMKQQLDSYLELSAYLDSQAL